MTTSNKLITKENFYNILEQASLQVFSGKGQERHGHGLDLADQPWKVITDNVGTGFVLGQALKKLMELRTFVPKENTLSAKEHAFAAWKREALGAIVYITMAILYKQAELYTEVETTSGNQQPQ